MVRTHKSFDVVILDGAHVDTVHLQQVGAEVQHLKASLLTQHCDQHAPCPRQALPKHLPVHTTPLHQQQSASPHSHHHTVLMTCHLSCHLVFFPCFTVTVKCFEPLPRDKGTQQILFINIANALNCMNHAIFSTRK